MGTAAPAVLGMVSIAGTPRVVQAQAAKPNILFILVDNLGYGELGVYGGGATRGAPTSRIDKLASEGMRLTNMNMETQCTPSRSSILTGRYAIRSGTHSVPFGGVADGLTQWEVTLAESLSAAGYATALYGKWHLGSQDGRLPNDQGTAFPGPPTRRYGLARAGIRQASCRRNGSWRDARAKRVTS
jgi:arylsulfatase A-like enzyme